MESTDKDKQQLWGSPAAGRAAHHRLADRCAGLGRRPPDRPLAIAPVWEPSGLLIDFPAAQMPPASRGGAIH